MFAIKVFGKSSLHTNALLGQKVHGLLAALGVLGTTSGWPDLIVAVILARLFLCSVFQIVRQALKERRDALVQKYAGA